MRGQRDSQHDSKFNSITGVVLGMLAIGLAGMVGTISLIRAVGEIGPKVGDIVAFDPTDPISADMKARVTATPTDGRPGVDCVLDVRAMHEGGGSLIIESRQPMTNHGMRVHWAGAHSANDSTNCGSAADLLLNQDDIEMLAMAAGGFGVPASKQHIALWGASPAVR
jgi:hypothetical protein